MLIPARKTDEQLKREVLEELMWDPRVGAAEVGVQVRSGVATLTGLVGTYAKKLAAQEAAHRVIGIRDVANDISVQLPGGAERTDADIAAAVRRGLEWDARVPADEIHSTVTNGWVTLEGTVERLAEREDASRAVRRLTGVVGVSNDIRVKPQPADPNQIRQAIEGALQRQARREADRILIEVHGSEVTISGTVRSWRERKAVLNAASGAGNVECVEEHLVVDPHS